MKVIFVAILFAVVVAVAVQAKPKAGCDPEQCTPNMLNYRFRKPRCLIDPVSKVAKYACTFCEFKQLHCVDDYGYPTNGDRYCTKAAPCPDSSEPL
ncbi:hypothetical protein ACOMHN_047808 [Nucella lapillus]